MQNNDLFVTMYNEVKNAHYILLVTHKNPDADTISSSLSLSNYFYENNIKHKVFNISTELPRKLNFLSKFEKITTDIPKFYDLIIYLDCADPCRVGKEFPQDVKTISIDHHQSNNNFANINIIDDSKSSTAELLYYFFKENKLKISKNVAECLYTGIYDDSLAFTTPRTNKETFNVISDLLDSKINVSDIANNLLRRESLSKFRIIPKIMNTLALFKEGKLATVYLDDIWIKETGATVEECDDIVDMVLSIGIVKIVVYFRIVDNTVRVSLRSKGDIDVSRIAENFNGGGHKNAAGLTLLTDDFEITRKEVISTILNYI
jgi:phosphoesterase RecJ-like protein